MTDSCNCGENCIPQRRGTYASIDHLAEFFIRVPSRPCATLHDLHSRSKQPVTWTCSTASCRKEFTRAPANLSLGEDGAPIVRCALCNVRDAAKNRALGRGISRSFEKEYPLKAAEFVRNLNHPARNLSDLTLFSKDLCEWTCSVCGERFDAKPVDRSHSLYDTPGCRDCHKRSTHQSAMSKTASRLVDEHPTIAKQFIRIPARPSVKVEEVSSGSNQMAEWRCNCGATFERKVYRVVSRNSIFCKDCSHTGKSLFEFEVAELLRASTGVQVETHHQRLSNTDVDLYFPDTDSAVQLDPYWSHYRRYTQDISILAKLQQAYAKVYRIRQNTLLPIPGHVAVTVHSKDREEWVAAVATTMGLPMQTLTVASKRAALEAASALWMRSAKNAKLDGTAADSVWAMEFVSNLTHPGKHLNFCARKSEDECKWACTYCEKTWNQQIDKRSRRLSLGCESCARKKNAQRQKNARQNMIDTVASALNEEDCKNLWENLYTSPQGRQVLRYVAKFETPVRLLDIEKGINMERNSLGQFKIRLVQAGALKSAGFGFVEFVNADLKTYIANLQ